MQTYANKVTTEELISCLRDPGFTPIEGLRRRPSLGMHKYVEGFESIYAGNFTVLSDAEPEDGNIILEDVGTPDDPLFLIFNNCNIVRIELKNCHLAALQCYNSKVKMLSLINSSCKELRIKNTGCDFTMVKGSTLDDARLSNMQTQRLDISTSIISLLAIEDNSACSWVDIEHTYCEKLQVTDKSNCGLFEWKESCGKSMIVSKSHIDLLNFKKNTQLDYANIRTNSEIGSLTIKDSYCWNLSLSDCKITGCILERTFQNFMMNNAWIAATHILSCRFHAVQWDSGNRGDFVFRNCQINLFVMTNATLPKDAVCTLAGGSLHHGLIQDTSILGQLQIRNVQAKQKPVTLDEQIPGIHLPLDVPDEFRFTFDRALNERKKFRVQDYIQRSTYDNPALRIPGQAMYRPVFMIVNSSLGKSEITGTNLNDFSIEFSKSKLLDLYITGTDFTKDNIRICGALPGSRESEEQLYFFYSQLKRVYENQGDMIAATKYHALMMTHQEKLLRLDWKQNEGKKTGWPRVSDWLELFTFRLNALSNRHGESWPQALAFTFIVSLAMYFIYYITLYPDPAAPGLGNWAGEYFSFLDPTHKQDFLLPKTQLNFWAKLVDFLSRIIIAYSIFQLVAAFRRHGRRAQ
ncbi:hypothetical protein [Chitinophaga sp. YIM B06452]|uniref:hypothetical protein n=1 Tax=Chitinophaga sp. YIM B06452 TaxID=3082158 RepID=UPI0031FE6E02